MVMGARTLGCFGKFFASPERQWPAMTVKLLRLDIRIRLQPFGDGNHKLSFLVSNVWGLKKKRTNSRGIARRAGKCKKNHKEVE
jgi:hypothetical protein